MPKTATAKSSKKRARKSAEIIAAPAAETNLHIVGRTEAGGDTTELLPRTSYKWAPLWLKVEVDLTPEAEMKQEHPSELPYPTKADLAREAAELIYQKKLAVKAKKGKTIDLTVDVSLLNALVESWRNRPVSKNEVRAAIEHTGVILAKMTEDSKQHPRDLAAAREVFEKATKLFEDNRNRQDSSKLDWVAVKEMAEEALDLAYAAEAEPILKRIRRRVVNGGDVARQTTEAQINFRLGYVEGGKRNFELRELDRDLKAMGWSLPEDRYR